MNNKGFAISTMLYGLSVVGLLLAVLMVQTVSASRGEQRKLVEAIEDELTEYEVLSQYFTYEPATYATDSGIREYLVPVTGWYKIELWESAKFVDTRADQSTPPSADLQAKMDDPNNAGGYTSVTLRLLEGSKLYFYLGKPETRETLFCNISTNCKKEKAIASSNEKFPSTGKASPFTDPEDPEIENDFSPPSDATKPLLCNYRSATSYLAQKINYQYPGIAKITLVSVLSKKKFNPAEAPIGNNGNKKSGAYYIIDSTTGKALTYNDEYAYMTHNINEIEKYSVIFSDLIGTDNQKWIYNPVGNSLVNVQTGHSLRTFEDYADGLSVLSDSQYSNRTLEKWLFSPKGTANAPARKRDIVGLSSNSNNNPFYIGRIDTSNSKQYYFYYNKGTKLEGATEAVKEKYENEEKKIQDNSTIHTTEDCTAAGGWKCDLVCRSYWFYVINAY